MTDVVDRIGLHVDDVPDASVLVAPLREPRLERPLRCRTCGPSRPVREARGGRDA